VSSKSAFGQLPNDHGWHRAGTSAGIGKKSSPLHGWKPSGQHPRIRHSTRFCSGASGLTRQNEKLEMAMTPRTFVLDGSS
jgi:hypothetical protein